MLGLLQRYQKTLIALIVTLLCISFLFFGMMPRGGGAVDDPVAFKLKDGRKIKRSHLEGLKALLETNNGEALVFGKALGSHFFTENFMISDLMKPGLLSLLVDRNYEELKEDLREQLDKEKLYKPYIHPNANFLSADSIWSAHAPEIKEELEKLSVATDPKEAFEIRQKLYQKEESFDAFALWQVLSDQQSQFSWLPKDNELVPERLQLFGYQSPKDWFGSALMEKTVALVLEVGSYAKAKGCVVSKKDAEQDLRKLNEMNFQKVRALGVKDFENAEDYYQAKLRLLGLHHHQMVDLWSELLIFRRFLAESAQSILLDTLSFEAFEAHAGEKVHVANYTLPKELQFNDSADWMQFEAYLHALGKPLDQLSLNFKRRPIHELSQKFPQLVEDHVHLSYQEVSLSKCTLNIQQKEVWSYKLNPQNILVLKKQFPGIGLQDDLDSKGLQLLFESLDPKTNYLVDQWVKESLVKKDEDWVTCALKDQPPIQGDFLVRKTGQGLPFIGLEVSQGKEFWLSQLFNDQEPLKTSHLKPFTFDQEHYYQIVDFQVLEKDQLVSYSTLKQDRTLEKLLYLTLKQENTSDLKVDKALGRAQEEVAKELFAPLKKGIRNDYLALHKAPSSSFFDDDFYTKYRLYSPMREALDFLKDHAKACEVYALNGLWNLNYQEKTYVRYLDDNPEIDQLLTCKVGHWTKVLQAKEGLEFSHVLSKPKDIKSYLTQRHLKKKIGHELKKAFITHLLDNENEIK